MKRHLIALLVLCFSPMLWAQTGLNLTDAKGKKQGFWRKNHPNGNIRYEGSFKDDQPEGIFRYYTEEGKLKMACFYYAKGQRSRCKGFDEKGNFISEGNYIGQKKDSVWTFFSESKAVVGRETWINGVKQGSEFTYYENGQISEELNWNKGKKDGAWKQFYEDGKPRLTATYKEGLLNGKMTYFYANGKVQNAGNYVADLREGTWYYFEENGNLKGTEVFKNGVSEKPFLMKIEKPEDEIREPMPGQ